MNGTASKWVALPAMGEFYDFEKELISFADEGSTSLDLRMTFNTEARVCYVQVLRKNDDGNTTEFSYRPIYLDWDVGLRKLLSDGCSVPDELFPLFSWFALKTDSNVQYVGEFRSYDEAEDMDLKDVVWILDEREARKIMGRLKELFE